MRSRKIIPLALIALLFFLCASLTIFSEYLPVAGANTSPADPQVGIWYSTWYSTAAKYVWTTGHGVGSTSQMLGDVNGDGKADAVVFFDGPVGSYPGGDWYVATSNGNGFDQYQLWTSGFGQGSAKQFLADVNGDGKADAVTFYPNGDWYVALSNGHGFDPPQLWKSGFGVGSTSQMIGDVNGDGKADAVVFYNGPVDTNPGGEWYVALSTGTSFGDYKLWIAGHGVGSTSQMIGDVNGDGKADAVVFFNGPDGTTPGGRWYVAPSNGNGFDGYTLWTAGHGYGSSKQFLADLDGDGKADAIVFFDGPDASGTCGRWYVALSNGSGFNTYTYWKNNFGYTSNWQAVSDVKGDKKASPIAFFNSDGSWKVMPADLNKFSKPNIVNTWEAGFLKPIRFRPLINNLPSEYDSGDPTVIDQHLQMMEDAQIDFLILDETNNINVDEGYIKERAKAVASRIAAWNASGLHRPIKYAIAIGNMQYTHLPQSMEDEAGIVWNEFVNTAIGGPNNYYYVNGKPLLVSYAEQQDRQTWESWGGDKSQSNQFTVRWLQGQMPNSGSNYPPSSDYGLYYGWGYWNGSLQNPDVMVVMPGWNNQHGGCANGFLGFRCYTYVSRYTSTGYFYDESGWQRVITTKPNTVVINSFNEFAEETAVEPADTSQVYNPADQYPTESWPSTDFFWNMTKQNIQAYRQSMLSDTTPPQGTITINNGNTATDSTNVTLNLSATDSESGLEGMRFRNQNEDWAPWQLYQQTASWTLPAGNGSKEVDVEYRDKAGNISAIYPAYIQLSCSGNKPTLSLNAPVPFWASYADYQARELSVSWSLSNNGNGNAYEVKITGSFDTNGVTVVSALPISIGTIAVVGSDAMTLKYLIPEGVGVWRTSLQASAQDGCGATYSYQGSLNPQPQSGLQP